MVKKVKEIYKSEDIPLLKIEPEPILEIEEKEISKPKREKKQTPREQQMNRPIFNSDAEKYEWLITHGCTNPEDRKFITKFIQSEQYNLLYGD